MLKLNDIEKTTVEGLLRKWGYDDKARLNDLEEDCSGAKSYYFEVYPSNIGDSVYLIYKDKKEFISDIDSF